MKAWLYPLFVSLYDWSLVATGDHKADPQWRRLWLPLSGSPFRFNRATSNQTPQGTGSLKSAGSRSKGFQKAPAVAMQRFQLSKSIDLGVKSCGGSLGKCCPFSHVRDAGHRSTLSVKRWTFKLCACKRQWHQPLDWPLSWARSCINRTMLLTMV